MTPIHCTTLHVDPKNKVVQTKTEGFMKCNRKIPIEDIYFSEKPSAVDMKVASQYLVDCVKSGSGDDMVQIEIDTPSKPIVLHYHAGNAVGDPNGFSKVNDISGIHEQYTVFFSPLEG
jgi:hypothetical protein